MTGRGPSTRQPRRRLVRSRALTREDSGHSDSGPSSDSEASASDRLGLDAEYRRLPGLVSSSSPWPAPPPPQGQAAMATGPVQPVPHSELGPSDAPAPTPAPSVISGWRRAAAAARAQTGDSGGLPSPSQAAECALVLTLSREGIVCKQEFFGQYKYPIIPCNEEFLCAWCMCACAVLLKDFLVSPMCNCLFSAFHIHSIWGNSRDGKK